ncbi:MAG: hypothetical protein Q4F69_02615 [Bacteroidia bacterium]|nr:hypothetical protein [Bacteroidia bacterium]
MNLANINFKTGAVARSGIGDTVYFIQKSHVTSWPVIKNDIDEALFLDDYVETAAGTVSDFGIAAGRRWSRLYSTQGKGRVTWEQQGEADCRVAVNKASLHYPRVTNEIRAFAKSAANGDFVFIVKHDGKYYIIGSRYYRTVLTTDGDSGDSAGSAKGVTVRMECPDTTPLPTYKGLLLMDEGVLDCNTDQFTNYINMSTNLIKEYLIEDGDTVRLTALSEHGRVSLEGEGTIKLEVAVGDDPYHEIEHDVEFGEDGLAQAPINACIGDRIRISAETLTKATVNWSRVEMAERSL